MKNSRQQQSTRLLAEITVVVSGYVPSKKNRRILVFGKILPPKEFILWQKTVKRTVLEKTGGRFLPVDSDGPCTVSLLFGVSDLRRRDIDNMVTSWLDALQEAGVISDDAWTSVGCVKSRLVYSQIPFSKATVTAGNSEVSEAVVNLKTKRKEK